MGNIFGGTNLATLTFAGLDSLLLATQNGSIQLGSNLTFQDLPALFVYARGATSNLTFDAGFEGGKNLVLIGENNLLLTNGIDVIETGAAGDDLNLYFFAGSDLTLGGTTSIQLVNDDDAANSADVSIQANGILNAGALTALLQNSGGTISDGANIGLFGGTSVSTGELNFLINNNDGGSIGSFTGIFVGSEGDLTVDGNLFMTILGIDLDLGPSVFGGEINLIVAAANVSVTNSLVSLFEMNAGGTSGFVSNGLFLTGDFTSGGDLDLEIDNGSTGGSESIGGGGTIDGNASVSFFGQNVSVGNRLEETIYNVEGGVINGDAFVGFSAGDVSTGSVFELEVLNTGFEGPTGGTITGNATVSIGGGNFTIAQLLLANIDNSQGGTIGGDATIAVNAGALDAAATFIDISNDGGTIDGTITIDVTAASVATSG